jgi:hypothetical protein
VGLALTALPDVHAQQSVLDRTLQADVLGEPAVWLPEAVANGMLATRIAFAGRVPLIFEAAPPVADQAGAPRTRVVLTGQTVRSALDVLIGADARYSWEERAGVIVIRPSASVNDANDVLNLAVGEVNWDDVPALEALSRIGTLVNATGAAPELAAPIVDTRPVSVHLGAGTLLDVLVSVAQAHGALFWSTPDVTKAFAPGSLAFQTFDGRGASVAVTTGR